MDDQAEKGRSAASRANFRDLAARAAEETSDENPRDLVGKEILHCDILHAMALVGFLDHLVFHGGTALRLCHGSVRVSEDLDFCAAPGFTEEKAAELGLELQRFLEGRYGLETLVSKPKKRGLEKVNIQRWWVRMDPGLPRSRSYGGEPWIRVKLEIADVQELESELVGLARNYNVISDAYIATKIRVATMESILADKLVAFPQQLPVYVRWRDIWDVNWLVGRGVRVNAALVQAKLKRYGIQNFDAPLAEAERQLPGLLGSGEMAAVLGKFVPESVAKQTLRNDLWLETAATGFQYLLGRLRKELAAGPDLDSGVPRSPRESPDPCLTKE